MSNETSTSNHGSHTCQSEVSTTLAMLISVFGAPIRAEAEGNIYEWRLELEGGNRGRIINLAEDADKTAKLQRWRIIADSKESLELIQTALSSGENYYDGVLHPELFIQRI